MALKFSLLNRQHNKNNFFSGQPLLDQYLKIQASQDVRRKLAVCFVLTKNVKDIIGYYTLSSSGIPRTHLSHELQQIMPPAYKQLPVTLLGRLVRDLKYKGQDIGNLLLIDALKRSYEVSQMSIASMAVVTDPIDDKAAAFYANYGFIPLQSGRMILSMGTIAKLLK
jgi:predicted GNAT family N-acyltransferase